MNDKFKIKYNFGKHYTLNPNFIDLKGDPVGKFIQKAQVRMQENLEDAVCDAIAKEAQAQGFTDLFVLDKKRIISALEKQIPKEVNYTSPGTFCCPNCWNDELVAHDKHCKNCGQALEW